MRRSFQSRCSLAAGCIAQRRFTDDAADRQQSRPFGLSKAEDEATSLPLRVVRIRTTTGLRFKK